MPTHWFELIWEYLGTETVLSRYEGKDAEKRVRRDFKRGHARRHLRANGGALRIDRCELDASPPPKEGSS